MAAAIAGVSLAIQRGPVTADTATGPAALLVPLRTGVALGWLACLLLVAVQERAVLWRALGAFRGRTPRPAASPMGVAETFRRAAAVSIVVAPRFLLAQNLTGLAVAAVWLVPAIACGYAYAAPALGPRFRDAYWLGAAALLLPWGLGAAVRWPTWCC